MEKIIIGGAAFIFGLSELKKAFENLGYDADFYEASFMNDYTEIEEKNLVTFTSDIEDKAGFLIPVSEYWITKAIENKRARISERALKASRNKVYFSSLLAESGVKVPQAFSLESALCELKKGKSLIVKPEGLYSGYGVRLVKNRQELESALEKCENVKTHSLKLFGINNKTPVIWENVCGTEYSADCFIYKGKMSVVRVCRKRILFIHDNPCTAAIQMIDVTERIRENLERWNKILFDDQDISFSQFDFIDDGTDLVPVDFAPRVGGGMADLLKMAGNPYADAVLGKDITLDRFSGKFPTQFNYLPVRSGKIKDLSFRTYTDRTVFLKKIGDFVPESPSSVASRIAVGLGFCSQISDMEIDGLLLGDEVIGDWKKVCKN